MSQTNATINEGFYHLAQETNVKVTSQKSVFQEADDSLMQRILPVIPKVSYNIIVMWRNYFFYFRVLY